MKANINIDYLILNLDLENPKLDFEGHRNDRFSFLYLKHSTRNFQSIGEIYLHGSHFATLTFNPYDNSIIKNNFAQLQLVNRFLYEPKKFLENTLIDCLSWFGAKVTGVNRLDLALDGLVGEIFHKDLPELHSMVTFTEDYLICGKEKDFNLYSTTKKGLKGWTLGSKTGDRFLRFYNKTKEIESNPKPHIQKYWEYNLGFTKEESNRVWRLEYQLNRRFLRSLDTENWLSIFRQAFIVSTFKSANNGFMDVRKNKDFSRDTDNPKIDMVDLSVISHRQAKDDLFERFKRPESIYEGKQLRQLKITLKKLFWIYWRGQQESNLSLVFVNKVMDCNRVYFEDLFFNKKVKMWIAEFENSEKLTYKFCEKTLQSDLKNTAGIEI